MFLRILGQSSKTEPRLCVGGVNCPNILEIDGGDFAVIGTDITQESGGKLLPGSGCGPGERVVRIPRMTLIQARADIPEHP